MAYNRGNPNYLPNMAALDCNGISPRNVWLPMSAEYSVDSQNRTYTITIAVYCFWAERIRLYMSFRDLVLGGEYQGTALVDGWVPAEDPGYLLATREITGNFNDDGTPDTKKWTFDASCFIYYYNSIGCTSSARKDLSNSVSLTIGNIEPAYTPPATPTAELVSTTDTRASGQMSVASFGIGGGNSLFIQASRNSNFSTIVATSNSISSLSGNFTVTGLAPNTKYYFRPVASNKGMTTIGEPFEGVTLVKSSIEGITPISSTSISVDLLVNNGGAEFAPTTYVDISTDGVNWTEKLATTSKSLFSGVIDDLEENTKYYVRTRSVTIAGTYTSEYSEITTPSHVVGQIKDVNLDTGDVLVTLTATSDACSTITASTYYRVAGMNEPWSDMVQIVFESGEEAIIALEGLIANYVDYEVYTHFEDCDGHTYDTDVVKFTTVPDGVENHTCESLNLMVQYICQSLKAIKEGNITIFMNDDTKKWCEEDDDHTPTLASILSRVQRFMHAVGCVLCSMGGFLELNKFNTPNQVFMGQNGWTDIDTEPIEGSRNIVESNGIYEAIDDAVHQVWHYVGDYDYFGKTYEELANQLALEDGAVGLAGNKLYSWDNEHHSWEEGETITPEEFGVIHVNLGPNAGKAYYWFGDGWNRLDLDLNEVLDRIEWIEEKSMVVSYDDEDYNVAILPIGTTDLEINSLVPSNPNKETIIVLTEDITE